MNFKLSFGRPKHGWLPLHLEVGPYVFHSAVSDVLNNPVKELEEIARLIRKGSYVGNSILLFEEPEETKLEFRADQDVELVEITVEDDGGAIIACESYWRKDLAKAVFAALHEAKIDPAEFGGRESRDIDQIK